MTDYSHLPDRAITIRQPWAWAIMNAGKRIENRPKRWPLGPICIHAGLGGTQREFERAWFAIDEVTNGKVLAPATTDMERGGIIGTATIADVITESDCPWFFGPFGLVLKNVQPVPFIPVKGALGAFKWKERL